MIITTTTVIMVIAGSKLLIEDDDRRFLALADLSAFVLPLAIRAPKAGLELLGKGGSPQRNGVDAAIALAAGDIDGAFDDAAGAMPGIFGLSAPASTAATIWAVMAA